MHVVNHDSMCTEKKQCPRLKFLRKYYRLLFSKKSDLVIGEGILKLATNRKPSRVKEKIRLFEYIVNNFDIINDSYYLIICRLLEDQNSALNINSKSPNMKKTKKLLRELFSELLKQNTDLFELIHIIYKYYDLLPEAKMLFLFIAKHH